MFMKAKISFKPPKKLKQVLYLFYTSLQKKAVLIKTDLTLFFDI